MTGTVKTIDALDLLFADNSSGAISEADLRDFLWSAMRDTVVSSSDAAVTAASGKHYELDISGFTANRNFTLPAGAPEGATISVMLTTGDADYELILIGAALTAINGGSDATEWSRIFITGETVVFRADSSGDWWVVQDGRIPCQTRMYLSSDEASKTNAQFNKVGLDAESYDVGGIGNTTSERIDIRRAGKYNIHANPSVTINNTTSTNSVLISSIYKNGAENTRAGRTGGIVNSSGAGCPTEDTLDLAVNDYIESYVYQTSDNGTETHNGTSSTVCFMTAFEVLE